MEIASVASTAAALASRRRVLASPSVCCMRKGKRARRDALEELVLAGEDRRDRVVGEDVVDRLGEQLRDREAPDLVGPVELVDRHRVGDGDLRQLARLDLLE